MGKITDITVQKKNKKRASIFIDNKFICGLELITVLNYNLKIGDELEPEDLNEIQMNSEQRAAFDKAIKYLSVRMRTKQEIRKFLSGKDYLDIVIDSVLEKLDEYKYVNDNKFVEAYVSTYKARSGKNKLRQELKGFGADEQAIDAALNELGSQTQDCFNIAEKYLRVRDKGSVDKNKLAKHLYSKGFMWDTIKEVVSKLLSEVDTDEFE